jgi:hypothetical protein
MKFYTLLLFLLMSAVPARADPQSENVGIDQIFYLEQTDAGGGNDHMVGTVCR